MSKGMRSFIEKIDKCRDCKSNLNHNYYTKEELQKTEKMTLKESQRISYCEKCEIIYINSKF